MLKLFWFNVLLLMCSLVWSFPIDEIETNEIDTVGGAGEDSDDQEIDLSHLPANLFGLPDNKSGAALATWTPDSNVNPEEMGSYLEGDILIPKSQLRNGMISKSTRWPNNIVPYVLAGSFSSNDRAIINRGIESYTQNTCIKLVPKTSEHRDYLYITNENSGCWSPVGRIGGRQQLNLQSPGCLSKTGTFIHEVMHSLGFLHEQNRHERDSYVAINWNNLQSGVNGNFEKASASTTDGYGVSYDYGSVMHYSTYAFSRNGQPTISAKQSGADSQMGQRDGFSRGDIKKINAMYGCSKEASSSSAVPASPAKPVAEANKPNKPTRPTRPSKRPRPSSGGPGGFIGFLGNLMGLNEGEKNNATTLTAAMT